MSSPRVYWRGRIHPLRRIGAAKNNFRSSRSLRSAVERSVKIVADVAAIFQPRAKFWMYLRSSQEWKRPFQVAYNHRILLVENSLCVDTHAGPARAHLLSTWFNVNGNRGKSPLPLPAFKSRPFSCQGEMCSFIHAVTPRAPTEPKIRGSRLGSLY